ncbi:MAG: 30S ribosomal protein S8 [Bacillota bacterium]|jgi:small subunit ribosomal protein S8|nr:MAG: 30S ribosomal protein S8 [Planctomycetota bacterium]RUA10542.1 MAG: 30S ribosomal protein S8 [Bacillota bacterium]HIO65552.1 30S ribosomal protein S8 [Planctomycetota bacterium]
MSMTDPIADLLTRIRNVNALGRPSVRAPYSRIKEQILMTLQREGFIGEFEVKGEIPVKELAIQLKYGPEGEHVIRKIDRISKPGCRVYSSVADLPVVRDGQGIMVVSTSQGILSDNEARQHNVGGEVICRVY